MEDKSKLKTILTDFLVRKLGNPKFMADVVIDDYLDRDAKTAQLLNTLNGPEISNTEAQRT